MTSTTTTMLVVCLLALTVGINVLTVADCTMLEGLVAPIEVIEEWGCYDTEIRLTCGNLESRVAILEAKFTPRCDEDRPEECVHVDENSVTYSFASQRVDKLTLEEKEAGQRFLQTLRRSHEHEKSPDETVPSIGAVHAANDNDSLRLHGSPAPVSARTVKDKRSSLRATLEHLIVRYLRRITSSGEDEEDDESGGYEASSVRYRRQVAIGYVNGTELAASGGGDNSTEVVGNEGPDSSVEITLLTNDSDSSGNGSAMMGDSIEITVPPAAEVGGMLGDGSAVENVNGGLPFGSSVSTSEEKSSKIVADSGERPVMKVSRKHKAAKKKECSSIRKRIAQLDRFELEKSMRNDSFREYNIRSALNYRCSGKNHCSFVFSQDHPFAVVWKEGTVRVKYICMDDFRISQYCDEHLIIGNEDQWERRRSNEERDVSGDATTEDNESRHHPSAGGAATTAGRNYYSDNTNDPVGFAEDRRQRNQWSYDGDDGDDDSEYDGDDYDDASKGEPRAEALQQQPVVHQMHSFHNLKILKTFPSEEAPVNETEHQRKLEAEAAYRKRQKVFSQDFRVLKILPSDLDEIEDIKQVGNEYFFKKGIEVIDESENEIVPDVGEGQPSINEANNQFTETLDIVVLPPPTKDADVYESEVDASPTTVDGGGGGAGDGTTINLVELITPTMVTRMQVTSQTQEFLDVHIRSTAGIPVEVTRSGETNATGGVTATTLGSVEREGILERYPDVESNEVEEDARANKSSPSEEEFSFNNSTFKKMQKAVLEEINVVQNGDGVRGAYPGNYDDDDEDDFEDEDDDSDDFDDSERRGHKKYISIQRTLLKHPLRQGFLMTPGYPKYYIGDSVCRWTLYAQRHQKIKLTILDLALRFDEPCRDYVEIRDLESNQTLFSSCSESTRPIVVVSVRERVEINVRTTTKVAYPKRGVLIHYSALGCELPSPIPPHMTLIRRSEYRAKYVCDPLYVFPDTAEPSRELVCTAKHTWNRPLPACVEKRATEGSGLVSHYEQKRKISDSETMSDNKADTVYDIVIPSMIIAALFIVNGIVFAVIMRYRNKRKQRLELDSKELAEL